MKTLSRIFLSCIFYFILYLQLSSDTLNPLYQTRHLQILLFTLTGPLLFHLGYINRFHTRIITILFIKALFALVILYPSGNSPALYTLLLSVFSVEAVLILDRRWFASFIFQAVILVFILLLPRRAWGIAITIPSYAFFPVLLVYLVLITATARKFIIIQGQLAKKDRELLIQQNIIDQVYQLNTQFQEYALNAEKKSAEEERKRITRDIHDIMGYTLVNLRVMLEVAVDLSGTANEKLSSLLTDAIHHTREGLQTARKALRNLRVIEDSAESWMNRMHRITDTFSGATGIAVRISWGNVTKGNCPKIKSAVYQFVQEALTNSFKHGKATSVEIDFRIEGLTPADHFIARVIDNGQGSKEVVPGIGLSGMQERIAILEGKTGYSNLDSGFEVWILIPMLSMRKES